MEVLSPNDVLFLKFALSIGATTTIRSLINRWTISRPPPVSFPLLQAADQGTKNNLVSSRSIKKRLEETGKVGIIFYGTQTGTAERLANRLAREASTRYNLDLLVADLDDYDFVDLLDLSSSQPVFFVLATYGDGESTDNAMAFSRYLAQLPQKQDSLSKLTYASFGLGSSAYQAFNAMILRVDAILTTRGARRLGAVGMGDDGKGTLEDDFTAWSRLTLSQVAAVLGLQESKYCYKPSFNVFDSADQKLVFRGEPNRMQLHRRIRGPYTAQNPLPAKCIRARELYQSERNCVHLEFDISESTMQYETGDHLAVWPVNSDAEVQAFMQAFNITDGDRVIAISGKELHDKVPIPSPTTYTSAARYYLDICAPVSCQMIRNLADFVRCDEVATKMRDLTSNTENFKRTVTACRMNIAQLISVLTAGNCLSGVPFSFLLENVPKLKPRHYSISSSCLESKDTISIAAVIDSRVSTTPNNDLVNFKGVCTNFLLALKHNLAGDEVANTHELKLPQVPASELHTIIHVRPSNFKLPRDTAIPIIMIGPGTGVAPFRAFVKERAIKSKTHDIGEMLLVYGCRDEGEHLYLNEWEQAQLDLPDGKFKMMTAYSRKPGCAKQYVQHLLKEHSQCLTQKVMHENAHVYVCGDAKNMAKDVWRCFEDMVGKEYLNEMKRAARWREDVW